MKNSSPSTLYTAKDLFHTIGGGMRNGRKHKNADNYASMKESVEGQIDKYDDAITNDPITLEEIEPLWTRMCEERRTAHNMYTSRTDLIQNIRNDLMRINGGGKTYKCPLCEVNDVYHLDHYIPREKMPEFSVHPQNLIYICHDCNEKKDTLWLDDEGNRIVFNAYYDKLSGEQLLVCMVDTIVNGFPWAEIVENPAILHNDACQRELSTLKNLGIDKRYERKVNEILLSHCNLAKEQATLLSKEGKSIDEIWNLLRNSYLNVLNGSLDVISSLAYQGIGNSTVMKDWLASEISV